MLTPKPPHRKLRRGPVGLFLPLLGTTPLDAVEITCGILEENGTLEVQGGPLRL